MFPTLSHLIKYLFNVDLRLPVQTFGLFAALAFVLAYQVFKSEFKRKERLGLILPFNHKITVGKPASLYELIVSALIGFILGFKAAGVISSYEYFSYRPLQYMFSRNGSLAGGILTGAVFIILTYYNKKRQQLKVPQTINEKVHPYQLTDTLILWCAFWGFIGAKIFSCLEDPGSFIHNPLTFLFSLTGWTWYGGYLFGATAYLFIGYRRGMKLVHLADIGSPGIILAYATGRMGCHLSGDGDWGIVNRYPKLAFLSWMPDWVWSFNFPHNVLKEGISINNCAGEYCFVLPYRVYPTSFYESVICLVLFFLLWGLRRRITIPGLMFCLYLILTGAERFFIEKIRVNQRYDFANMSFTQAELISFLMIIGGLAGLFAIKCKAEKC